MAAASVWTLLSVTVPVAAEEVVTAVFLAEDAPGRATGLLVEDAAAGALATAGTVPAPGELRLSTYCPTAEADAVAAALRARLAALVEDGALPALPEMQRQPVAGEDWRDRWREFFDVVHVSARVVIRPPWREYAAAEHEVVVDVEPGLAFGTGGHQTTQLCLRAIERALAARAPAAVENATLLDVGTGSGVLAIAAVRLGVRRAVALDEDALALESASENVARNGVAGQVEVSGEPLAAVLARGAPVFEVVVANIISGTLLALRAPLVAATAPGGTLVLAGILSEEEDRFRASFEGPELALCDRETMEDWVMLAYRRAGRGP